MHSDRYFSTPRLLDFVVVAAAGQAQEDVLQAGLAAGQVGQAGAAAGGEVEQADEGGLHVGGLQGDGAIGRGGVGVDGGDGREGAQVRRGQVAGGQAGADRGRHPEPADQGGRGVAGDDAPAVHDRDPVAELLGLLHVVGGQDDRRTAGPDPADGVPEVAAGLRVEPGRRLVEEDDAGVVDQGQGDREALLLPARKLVDQAGALLLEPDHRQQVVDPRLGGGHVVEPGEELQQLGGRQVVEERRRLKLDADDPADRVAAGHGVEPGDADRAGVGGAQALDHLQGRRLSGAVGAEDAEDLPLGDEQVDAGDGGEAAVALDEAAGLDDRVAGRGCRRRARRGRDRRERIGVGDDHGASAGASARWPEAGRTRDGGKNKPG